jgi:hypothetical protein
MARILCLDFLLGTVSISRLCKDSSYRPIQQRSDEVLVGGSDSIDGRR